MKVVFNGFYGMDNSGDDAFVEVAAWGSKKFWKSDDQLFFAERLPVIKNPSLYYRPKKSYLNFARAVKDVFLSDAFVSAGGSIFHSALKRTEPRSYAFLKKKIYWPGQTGAIGVSLGPYKNVESEKSIIKYLKSLDFLALRDNRSYEMALSYNLPYKPVNAFDMAALLPEIYNHSAYRIDKKNKAAVVGISVCNYESYIQGDIETERRRNNFVVDLINLLKSNPDILFRFFVFNGHVVNGDNKITNEIIQRINKNGLLNFEIIPYNPCVEEVYHKISNCDVIISTRLHASIFACYSGTPFFLLEYHQKCTDFLIDIGQPDKCRVLNGEVDVKSVADTIQRILYDKEEAVAANIDSTIKRAKLNFTNTYKTK